MKSISYSFITLIPKKYSTTAPEDFKSISTKLHPKDHHQAIGQ